MTRVALAALLAVLPLAGCSAVRTVSIDTDPQGAKLLIDGVEIGSSPRTHAFDFAEPRSYRLTAQMEGFVDSFVRVSEIYLEARGENLLLKMDPDEAYQNTIPSDLANNWINIEANPRLEESIAWPRLVETVNRFYPKLATTNTEAGYLATQEKVEGFRQGPDTAKVTNVLFCSLVSKSPVTYKIKIESRINVRGKTENYPRVLKSDAALMDELRASLTAE